MRWLARGEPHLPRGDDSWLSPAEAARAAAMRFTKRRTEFLVARWSAKEAIARRLLAVGGERVDPRRVEVRHHVTGAPEAYLDGRPLDVGISLTDRAGWAVCVLGGAPGEVGCDLELVEPRSPAFVRDYFTAAERDFVGADPLAANLLWSAKESALKVLRTGLRRDTRTVEVATVREGGAGAVDGWTPLTVRAAEGAVFHGWWRRYGDFVLTTAAARPVPPPVPLEDHPALAAAVPVHSWLDRPAVADHVRH
ncbi:MAG TPA: 4'-phosphopantetheinyl transferase superfamily protein [Streptosporangiaceae bacterium]|nr:4'-phosphopantetheinyl transferase superfamily protein [Streptosporangiaceae bacterium]